MLKYVDTKVTFAEIPNEISLCINISGCPNRCPGCHSKYLQEDIGEELTTEVIDKLITENKGITCVCFMGGDSDPAYIIELSKYIKLHHFLSVGIYSGKERMHADIVMGLGWFDYIKLGPYIEEKGPLNSPTTNQRLLKIYVEHNENEEPNLKVEDLTYLFWKDEIKN